MKLGRNQSGVVRAFIGSWTVLASTFVFSAPQALNTALLQPYSVSPSGGGPTDGVAFQLALPESIAFDDAVEPAQATAPRTGPPAPRTPLPRGTTRTQQTFLRTSSAGRLASVPYMIGDTGAGTCIGFTGMVDAAMSHPTLACGRLNVAESNTPRPVDRLYYSYRHFHNSSMVTAFQFTESVNYDRFTLAGEKTLFDGAMSIETRLPIDHRLTSDLVTLLDDPNGIYQPIYGSEREVGIGNVAVILKCLLYEDSELLVSGGLGITLPTARNVDYSIGIEGPVFYPNPPGLSAYELFAFTGTFFNETVYLEPFLAWIFAPEQSRWFHQGFLQVEVAANPSHVSMRGGGIADAYFNNVYYGTYGFVSGANPPNLDTVEAKLIAQTLMRLNLGFGYRMIDDPQADLIQRLSAIFEVHYTSTLNDASLGTLPLTFVPSGTEPFQDVRVGNLNNRVDIINVATGVSMGIGRWTITHGFVAPVRGMPNRGFDFEYNMQMQRMF